MLEIALIVLLLLINSIFVMSEIAVISARQTRLQQLADNGDHGAAVALSLSDEPNRFLATVQIGITLVSILTGALGSATIADKLAVVVSRFERLAPYSETISIGVVVLAITYFSLIIGELVPKRLALLRAERVAATLAPFMHRLSLGTSPIVHLLSRSTDAVVALLGVQPNDAPSINEEDIKYMIGQGTQVGVFAPIEEELVHEIFRLGDLTLQDLIVPRMEIVWLDLDASPEELQQKIASSRHTRFPVGRGNLDEIVGIVLTKDLLIQSIQNLPLDISAVMYPPVYVPATMPSLSVLAYFQETHTQIALVVGEYGELQGLITVNDIVEAMVGDLPETVAEVEPEIVERDDGSWLVDGLLPIHRLRSLLDLQALPGEEEKDFRTLGGLVMTSLDQIPNTGNHFTYAGFRFEVMDMDAHRVDKVLIRKLPT